RGSVLLRTIDHRLPANASRLKRTPIFQVDLLQLVMQFIIIYVTQCHGHHSWLSKIQAFAHLPLICFSFTPYTIGRSVFIPFTYLANPESTVTGCALPSNSYLPSSIWSLVLISCYNSYIQTIYAKRSGRVVRRRELAICAPVMLTCFRTRSLSADDATTTGYHRSIVFYVRSLVYHLDSIDKRYKPCGPSIIGNPPPPQDRHPPLVHFSAEDAKY
ncbi:unnamed protein product, partial [Rhizoctonia solani]